jgi:hypothetical protein
LLLLSPPDTDGLLAPAYDETTALLRGQTLVDHLMSARMETVAGETRMTVIRNMPTPDGEQFDLVVRECTVPFWQACISAVEWPNCNFRVCAIGSPGIGKTTSTFVLLRMLLQQRRRVVYHVCRPLANGYMYEFRCRATYDQPSSPPYICEVHSEASLWEIQSLRERGTFYVVDPGQTSRDCVPSDDFLPRVIVVSSPNDVHWGGEKFTKFRRDIVKISGGLFFYYPLWSWAELRQARELLNAGAEVDLSLEEMSRRFPDVGGVPRHLWMREKVFPIFVEERVRPLNRLSPEQTQKIAMGQWNLLVTNDSTQPKSMIIGYEVEEGSEFLRAVIVPISWMIRQKVFEYHLYNIWNTVCNRPNPGTAFEEYTWLLMMGGAKRSMTSRPCVGYSKPKEYLTFSDVQLGGCKDLQKVDELMSAARNEPKTLFLPSSNQEEFIDFVYAEVAPDPVRIHFHAFQATYSGRHEAKQAGISHFEAKLQPGETATVYYLVPSWKFRTFRTTPVEPESRTRRVTFRHVQIPIPTLYQAPMPSEVDTGPKRRRRWPRKP